ncbi:response regulator [Erythrobacter sp.]|jgi:DNA-binding response OmpR family regulator|uniref:response regulator n=1 Tax=Erythrobacter sp. TaxID=1042 RepID=UPI002EB63043|nr:response regulator [Erythrobacter sp.]
MTRRILIAEDEMVVAFDLCETVEEAGFEVEGPHSGIASAADACDNARPDVAILDVELRDGNIFSFAEKLREKLVPVIFHSGSLSAQEVVDRFPDATVLMKPCPPADMLNAVNHAVQPAAA